MKVDLLARCRNFKREIEKIKKCEFWELDIIFEKNAITLAKLFIEWLKFNFIYLQEDIHYLNEYFDMNDLEIDDYYIQNNLYIYFDSIYEFRQEFKDLKENYQNDKKIAKIKSDLLAYCKNFLRAIKIKDEKYIPNALKRLNFPDLYQNFQAILPFMIDYKRFSGKNVFWNSLLTNQFKQWFLRKRKEKVDNA